MSLLPVSREVEDVCVSSAAEPTNNMKTNHSKNRSLKQNSNRLAAYLATGIGAGLVATPAADAAIVTIDLTSSGFGIDGPNAGLSPGSSTVKSHFPFFTDSTVKVNNGIGNFGTRGLAGLGGLTFAAGSSFGTPVKFTPYQSIDSSANWNTPDGNHRFAYFGIESPDFGSDSYMGFKSNRGHYGWLEVTWAAATDTFQIYSGAYESVANVPILAGYTGTSAVPEPGQVASSLLLLTLGAAGVAIQRQRAKKKQAAAS